MDFIDQLRGISDQIPKLRDQILGNEQATKSALIMPFMQALGYNVFNPGEVYPEFGADVPEVKGDKVDYAILQDGKPIILIECKSCGESLEKPQHISQLFKYFNATEAKFSILTNGIIYRFYSDLEKQNIMDSRPFLEFNMLNIQEAPLDELKKFSKSSFNPDELKNTATSLMYTREIKRIMAEQLINPSPEFVKFFASQIYQDKLKQSVIDMFADIVKSSLSEFIKERITGTLQTALKAEDAASIPSNPSTGVPSDGIITTEEELEGFLIVKAILSEVIDPKRIQLKDTKSYAGILLDGNTWKTVCRLRFNSKQKYVSLFSEDKKEVSHPIDDLHAIYRLASELKSRVSRLDKGNVTTELVSTDDGGNEEVLV
uniref:type I restriction endonuclease n=1 Tax=Trichocoleus desertorum TaxID=1481672 RepID=UPI0025B608FB|nr:type I restriction endonuclease [Trichocoleus desertorum]